MSIAIKRKNGDLIWLDAVVTYSRQYSSSITKHPIESGSSITDNVSKENPRFSINGIITNADFNTTRPLITPDEAKENKLSDRRIYNSQPIPDGASPIIGKGASSLLKYLPTSVTQFTGISAPSVTTSDSQRPDWVYDVEEILRETERTHELVSILDFSIKGVIRKVYDDCYISNITFAETVDTGGSFDLNMELEQVTFVTLEDEVLSEDVVNNEIKGKVSSEKNKGNKTPEKVTPDSPSDIPNAKEVKTSITDDNAPLNKIFRGKS